MTTAKSDDLGKREYGRMKIKPVVSLILLTFVVCSLAYLFFHEDQHDGIEAEATARAEPENAPKENPGDAEPSSPHTQPNKLIAYYFHGTKRCSTCMTIEAITDESLKTNFADELATGRLVWSVINVDEPGNEHYVYDFKLPTRSVVLVDVRDGEQQRWKNLTRIWELVRDKEAFSSYIEDETRSFLGEQDG